MLLDVEEDVFEEGLDMAITPNGLKTPKAGLLGIAILGMLATMSYSLYEKEAPKSKASCNFETTVLKTHAKGDLRALTVPKTARTVPNINFTTADHQPMTLENWKGRVVLLNLWATWCAPCREEMPALDHLQAALGSDDFEVVTLNIDTRNTERVETFWKETGLRALTRYSDKTAKSFQDLKANGQAFGMPTTILIDREGCEVASLSGAAHWDSEDAKALIRAVVNQRVGTGGSTR